MWLWTAYPPDARGLRTRRHRLPRLDGHPVLDAQLPAGAHHDLPERTQRIDGVWWAPDSDRVVFIANANAESTQELFVADATGRSSSPIRLSGPLGAGQSVITSRGLEPVVDPRGRGMFYVASDPSAPSGADLYFAPFAAPGLPIELGAITALGAFEVARDGSLVAFSDRQRLYGVDMRGSTPGASQPLTPPLAPGVRVATEFSLVGDAEAVVYLADVELERANEAFHTVLEAGGVGLTTKLNPIPPSSTFDDVRTIYSED